MCGIAIVLVVVVLLMFPADLAISRGSDSLYSEVGQYTWGGCGAVALRDTFAIIGNGTWLQVLDISDPFDPVVVGEHNTCCAVSDIIVSGSLAYVLSGPDLLILDAASIPSIDIVSVTPVVSVGWTVGIQVEGSAAYVTAFPPLLHVVDLSEPAAPNVRGSIVISERFGKHSVRNGIVYIGDLFNVDGLYLYDARNPDSLVLARWIETAGYSRATLCEDTLLYLGGRSLSTGAGFLEVYSIRDELAPVLLSSESITASAEGTPWAISQQDNILFLATQDSGIFSYDVADPYLPVRLGQVYREGAPAGHLGIVAHDTLLGIATGTSLWMVGAQYPESMNSVTNFITGYFSFYPHMSNGLLYLAQSIAGLAILDIEDPGNITRLGAIEVPRRAGEDGSGDAYRVDVKGGYAYVLTRSAIEIIDVSNKLDPKLEGYHEATIPLCLAIDSSTMYVLEHETGFRILDISDPVNPQPVGEYFFPKGRTAVRLAASDDVVAIAAQDDGLVLVNVAEPSLPVEIGTYPGFGSGVLIKDNYIFSALYTDSTDFVVLSIQDPMNPTVVGFYSLGLPGYSYTDMAYSSNTIYVNTSAVEISAVDSPKYLGSMFRAYGVAADGPYLYATDDQGLKLFGNSGIVRVADEPALGPTGFALHQNYPNPFNESTILSFTLAQPGEVRVSVFDAIGSLIASIYHGKSPAGLNSIQFNPQGLSSGTYFLEMSVDRKSSQIRKMVLLK